LAQPRDDWQRLRLATVELLYGAYAERASRKDALAVAEHGTARIAELAGAKSLTHAFALNTLGQLRYFRGDYLGAEHDADAALDILHAWPQRTMDRGRALNVAANSRRILGDFAGARAAYTEAIALAEAEPREDTLPGRLDGLAQLERKLGNDTAARELFERALSLIAEPTKDRRAMTVLANLGDLALERGDLDVAQRRYDVALAIARSVYGPQHEARLRPQQGAALVALRRGHAAEAVQQLRDIAQAERAAYGDDYAPLQFTRCALALAQARNGDFAAAWEGALAAERQRIALLRRFVPLLGATQALGFKRGL
jgi:tetratricopeptide (TPR) repeat protein